MADDGAMMTVGCFAAAAAATNSRVGCVSCVQIKVPNASGFNIE